MKRHAIKFVGGIAASAIAIVLAAPAAAEDYIVDNVTLIDGTGQPNQQAMSIGIDKGKITFVTPTAVAPKVSGQRIDGTGRYLIPGLMDVHIHLQGARGGDGRRMVGKDPKNPSAPIPATAQADAKAARVAGLQALASYLYSGVTTVYDAGNVPEHILGLRADERAGKIQSPRIFATGNLVTYPGSHGDSMAITIDNWSEDKPKLLKYLEEQKPDIVKLTLDEHGWGTRPLITLLPLDLMQEIILEVNRHGIRTTAHTSSELRATEAIFAGIDSLAHPVIQGPISEEFAKLMGAKKVAMATTLTIGEGYSRLVEHPEYLDQPLYRAAYNAAEIGEMRSKTLPAWKERGWTWWMKLMTPIAQENMRMIDAAGGVIAIATDQTLGPAVHREMELLQAAGVPAARIVTIATLNGAKHLGKDDILGSIEPGKLADMVLLSADPTVDIDNAKKIVWVMKGGQLIDEERLPLAGGTQNRRRDF
ncbi:amidohydrolase family protein [Allosphingosinicella indica]|uniref:Imidazolonepropionase n=1 Tax=Allosphingosinicella indica TaxID=941907 RepID=A0A1X7FYA2_9SPHN|nr:amidohydrolase family protein [Allosphingosinicella indica]SMF60956.1 Imidazolonepropionase [Allosphingosinicella indica]